MVAISFPQFISWKVYFKDNDPFSPFGEKTTKRIKKTLERTQELNYRFVLEKVTDSYLDSFVPLYEKHIGSKERGTIFPVRERIHSPVNADKTYHAISLYYQDTLVGGVIFFVHMPSSDIAIMYSVFPHEPISPLPMNLSTVADYFVYVYATKHEKDFIDYGNDRNMYGYYSNIGLAAYKMRMGAQPFISEYKKSTGERNQFFEAIPQYPEDMFCFLGTTPETFVTKALFISEKSSEELSKAFPILFTNDYFKTIVVPHTEIRINAE